jgi:hypothetical protein
LRFSHQNERNAMNRMNDKQPSNHPTNDQPTNLIQPNRSNPEATNEKLFEKQHTWVGVGRVLAGASGGTRPPLVLRVYHHDREYPIIVSIPSLLRVYHNDRQMDTIHHLYKLHLPYFVWYLLSYRVQVHIRLMLAKRTW